MRRQPPFYRASGAMANAARGRQAALRADDRAHCAGDLAP